MEPGKPDSGPIGLNAIALRAGFERSIGLIYPSAPDTHWRMSGRCVFGVGAILLLTAAFACWCRAPLLWDGAYQFNATLIQESPYHYLTRFHSYLLWWPTVWAAHFTSNVTILQSIYGLPFLLAPLIGLLMSWWMVKDDAPRLILWAIFGVAIGTLPGQIFVINDSIFQQHLFWPIFMGMLVPLSWPKRAAIAALVVFQFVHPIGIFLLAGAACAAGLLASANPDDRRRFIRRAVVMGALAMLAVGKVYITSRIPAYRDTYAEREAGWSTAWARWHDGVSGWPIRGLCYAWAAALMIFLRPLLERRQVSAAVLAALLALLGIAVSIPTLKYGGHLGDLWLPAGAGVLLAVFMFLAEGRPLAAGIAAIGALAVVAIRAIVRVCLFNDPSCKLALVIVAGAAAGLYWCILRSEQGRLWLMRSLPLLSAAAATGVWAYWASDGRIWWKALDYRRWILPLTLPFFMLAALEAWRMVRQRHRAQLAADWEDMPETPGNRELSHAASPAPTAPDRAHAICEDDDTVRPPLALWLGATFAIVIGLQSWVWHEETGRLMAAVERSPYAIVPDWDFPWMAHTPLDHWAAQDYVMAMEGKQPARLLLDLRAIRDLTEKRPPQVPHSDLYPRPPDPAPRGLGWFDLRPFLQQIKAEPPVDGLAEKERLDLSDVPP